MGSLVALFFLTAVTGCSATAKYTSQDLALLPCEAGAAPIFFFPLEFRADNNGEWVPAFKDQKAELEKKLVETASPVSDLIVFVHGWNKNPSSAERDYQDFLCRLHGHLRSRIKLAGRKSTGQLVVLGVFWPSTLVGDSTDPLWLKPISYFKVRRRADGLAQTGFANLVQELSRELRQAEAGDILNVHLAGHSFGGRIIVRGLRAAQDMEGGPAGDNPLKRLIRKSTSLKVVLLNPAVPPEDFSWVVDNVLRAAAGRTVAPTRFQASHSTLYNVHSLNDAANRWLFPIGSLFDDDPVECAAGACGVAKFRTLCLDSAANIIAQTPPPVALVVDAWNVDATPIVFGHSDIYKGRLAKVLTDLLYPSTTKIGDGVPEKARCEE